MVNSVDAHFDHHEKIPLFFRKKMAGELEALTGHFINVSQHLFLIAGAKIPHIHNIFSDDTRDFVFEFGRMCVIAGDIGSEKISDQQSIEWLRRICSGYADDNRAFPISRKNVPNSVLFYGERICNRVSVV